jgi:hypothetical protein
MFIGPQLLGKGNFDLIFLHGTPKTMKSLAKQHFMKNSMKYIKILKMMVDSRKPYFKKNVVVVVKLFIRVLDIVRYIIY